MATEISRTFDLAHGSVVVVVRDEFGGEAPHTIYVTGVDDVDATVEQLLLDTDASVAQIRQRLMAAGWKG